MASISFGPGTVVPVSWLQDINDFVYGLGNNPQNIADFFANISQAAGAEIVGYSAAYNYPAGTIGAALRSFYAPAAPVTSQPNSTVTFSLNETANTLLIRAQYSSGAVKSATIALT